VAFPGRRWPEAGAFRPTASRSRAFVELRDESQKSDRFVLRLERIEGNRIVDKPQRVRLSVRRGMAPPAGAFVEAKAQLNPPLQPLRPGSYDFARDHSISSASAPPASCTGR
jgi:competence protein ComEC